VPAKQTGDGRGKGIYPLSSTMTPLTHLTEAPSAYGPDDANIAAFVEATSIIESRDAVEEFFACGLCSLNENFGFEAERKEAPLSKVLVLMPLVATAIRAQEPTVEFEACIVNAVNVLVGNYNIIEHKAYEGLRHG
jgi:hypothetical protein